MPTADIWEQKKILRYVSFKATIAAPSLNVFVKVEKSHYLFLWSNYQPVYAILFYLCTQLNFIKLRFVNIIHPPNQPKQTNDLIDLKTCDWPRRKLCLIIG